MSDSFFIKNKTAIIVTALAVSSAVGAYWFYNQLQSTTTSSTSKDLGGDSTTTGSSSSKKNKKKKKSKNSSSPDPEASSAGNNHKKSPKYPVNSKGLPEITSDVVKKLSEQEKEEWAVQLKEDGNTEFKNKKYENAIAYYTAALQLKKDPIYYSNRSACYAALDDHRLSCLS